jgi:hypothetical protein
MEIVGIETGERHLLLFFFTPTPTRHSKGVNEKKNQNKRWVLMRGNYVISLAKLCAKLKNVA